MPKRSECRLCEGLGLVPVVGHEIVKSCDCVPVVFKKIDVRPWWVREQEEEYLRMVEERANDAS